MLIRCIATAFAAALAAAPATSQCFNVDLGTVHGSPSPSYGGAAGQPGFWNELPIVEGVLYPLADHAGNPTKSRFLIKDLYTAGNWSGASTGGPAGEHAKLLNDYIDDPLIKVRFERLDPGTYLIYTYGWSPKSTNGFDRIAVTVVNGLHVNDFSGDAPWTGKHVVHESYVTDLVNVDASGQIMIFVCNYAGSGRPSGFQLVRIGDCPSQSVTYCDQGPVEGCDSIVQVSGRPNASLTERFQVEAVGVATWRSGLYFFGINGQQSVLWSGSGFQCVAPPVQRTDLMTTGANWSGAVGCNGQLSLDFNGWMTAHPGKAPPPGSTVQIQGWTFDPVSPSSNPKLLDAIEFTIQP